MCVCVCACVCVCVVKGIGEGQEMSLDDYEINKMSPKIRMASEYTVN